VRVRFDVLVRPAERSREIGALAEGRAGVLEDAQLDRLIVVAAREPLRFKLSPSAFRGGRQARIGYGSADGYKHAEQDVEVFEGVLMGFPAPGSPTSRT